MNESNKKINNDQRIWLEYLIAFSVCAIGVLIWAAAQGIFTPYEDVAARYHWHLENDIQKVYYILVNGTFGIGIICTAIGLFIIASNGGAYDMIFYGVRRFISLFQKEPNKFIYRTYYDYHMAKQGRKRVSFLYLLIVGGFYILLSGLFLLLLTKTGFVFGAG